MSPGQPLPLTGPYKQPGRGTGSLRSQLVRRESERKRASGASAPVAGPDPPVTRKPVVPEGGLRVVVAANSFAEALAGLRTTGRG